MQYASYLHTCTMLFVQYNVGCHQIHWQNGKIPQTGGFWYNNFWQHISRQVLHVWLTVSTFHLWSHGSFCSTGDFASACIECKHRLWKNAAMKRKVNLTAPSVSSSSWSCLYWWRLLMGEWLNCHNIQTLSMKCKWCPFWWSREWLASLCSSLASAAGVA